MNNFQETEIRILDDCTGELRAVRCSGTATAVISKVKRLYKLMKGDTQLEDRIQIYVVIHDCGSLVSDRQVSMSEAQSAIRECLSKGRS